MTSSTTTSITEKHGDLVVAHAATSDSKQIAPYSLTEERQIMPENPERQLHVIPRSKVTAETTVIPVRFHDNTEISEIVRVYGADIEEHPYSNLLKYDIKDVLTLKTHTSKSLAEKQIPIEFVEWCRTQGIPIADIRASTTVKNTSSGRTTTQEFRASTSTENTNLAQPPPMVEVKEKITKKEKAPHKDHHSMLKAKYFNPTWWYKKMKEKEISVHAENNDDTGEIIVKFGRRQFAIHTVHKHHEGPPARAIPVRPVAEVRTVEHHLHEGHQYDAEGHPLRLDYRGLPEQIQTIVQDAIADNRARIRTEVAERRALEMKQDKLGEKTVVRRAAPDDIVKKEHLKIHRQSDDDRKTVKEDLEAKKTVHV